MPPAPAVGELAAKHLIAQVSKGFFGYGPKGRTAIWLQGRLAVFATELVGPQLMAALAAEPFGRICMRHINSLYVRDQRGALTAAAAALGVELRAVASDLDFTRRWTLGVGVGAGPLPGAAAEDAAPAPLRGVLERALGQPVRDARAGPLLVHGRIPLPPGLASGVDATAEETFARLQAWEGMRSVLGGALDREAARAGLPLAAVAAVDGGDGDLLVVLVAGGPARAG